MFYIIFNPFQLSLNFMICMGLAALFYYQGKAAKNSRKKINIDMIAHGTSSTFPAPHESEFYSGSKKLTKVISINSKDDEFKLN